MNYETVIKAILLSEQAEDYEFTKGCITFHMEAIEFGQNWPDYEKFLSLVDIRVIGDVAFETILTWIHGKKEKIAYYNTYVERCKVENCTEKRKEIMRNLGISV